MRLFRIEHERGSASWLVAADLIDAAEAANQLHGSNVTSIEARTPVIISNKVRKQIAEQHRD